MSLYKDVLKSIKSNKEKRLRGDIIAIPWDRLPRISKVLPGVIKENYTIVSANSKVGKTQLADFLYVYQPIDWLFDHRESNIDIDIQYFSLEMSKEAKMRQAMSYRLFTKYRVVVSPQDLRSIFNDYVLDDEVEKLLGQEQEWFDFFESKITYIDTVRNPYGIYSTVKNKMESEGEYVYKTIKWTENGQTYDRQVRDYYVPKDPDKITVVLTDHVGLLTPEREDNGKLYNTLGRFSSRYCLEMRDLWKCQIVNVQQQAATSEEQKYTMIGGTILDKVKPSPDGLGDNKGVSRDANLMISLFHPARYRQKEYNGIDLKRMNDAHREFYINLNRDGVNNAHLDLYFQGACNYFEEMPTDNLEKFYEKISKVKERKYEIS